jgi:hypothetical protein
LKEKLKIHLKDKYGRYVETEEFSSYWDSYHQIEDLSMKESIRQKKERSEKIESKK